MDAEGWGMLGLKKEGFIVFFLKLNRFGFFGFLLIKPKLNRTSRFFKILIGLIGFFLFGFFGYFFRFSRFNRFFGFFAQ